MKIDLKSSILPVILLFLMIQQVTAQLQADTLTKALPDKTFVKTDTVMSEAAQLSHTAIPARLEDFPTLHPIVVHFAISLIIVAALLQVFNILFFKKELAWVVLLLLLAGVAAALVASKNFHPHVKDIPEHAWQVLLQHDEWAEWTIRTGIVAIVLQVIHMVTGSFRNKTISTPKRTLTFSHRKNRLLMILIAVVALASAWCVLRAGHLGAQLVHIEGVGPQGRFLDKHED